MSPATKRTPKVSRAELARQQAKARRTGRLIVVLIVVIAAVTLAAILSLDDADESVDPSSIEGAPEATEFFGDLSRTHVTERVDYPQTPPVGGDHNPTWWNCGAYAEPIVTEAGVHSLEHGAVWIAYAPDLPAEQVALLEAFAEQTYVLVAPWPDDTLPAPIVFSAWGAQLRVEEVPSSDAEDFLHAFRRARSAPEPGAPCTGGAPG